MVTFRCSHHLHFDGRHTRPFRLVRHTRFPAKNYYHRKQWNSLDYRISGEVDRTRSRFLPVTLQRGKCRLFYLFVYYYYYWYPSDAWASRALIDWLIIIIIITWLVTHVKVFRKAKNRKCGKVTRVNDGMLDCKIQFLSETPKRFRLMLSSMSASAYAAAVTNWFLVNISEISHSPR